MISCTLHGFSGLACNSTRISRDHLQKNAFNVSKERNVQVAVCLSNFAQNDQLYCDDDDENQSSGIDVN